MSSKEGAYGARAGDTDFRKKWDKEEYAEKARQRDQEEKERMQENEERMKQGVLQSIEPHPPTDQRIRKEAPQRKER